MDMKHFQRIVPLLLAAIMITSCGGKESSPDTVDESASASTTRAYTDGKGQVEVTLPSSWVSFSAFDGTPLPIEHLGDDIVYGAPDGMRILFELFDAENASKNPDESWYEFFLRLRLDSSTHSVLEQKEENGIRYYVLSIENDDPAATRYYALFERENMILSLGFYEDNPTTRQIMDSVKFIR